jgi:hypothetical protein
MEMGSLISRPPSHALALQSGPRCWPGVARTSNAAWTMPLGTHRTHPSPSLIVAAHTRLSRVLAYPTSSPGPPSCPAIPLARPARALLRRDAPDVANAILRFGKPEIPIWPCHNITGAALYGRRWEQADLATGSDAPDLTDKGAPRQRCKGSEPDCPIRS